MGGQFCISTLLTLSYSNGNQSLCDSVILDLLSREFYYALNEKCFLGGPPSNFHILERRLRVDNLFIMPLTDRINVISDILVPPLGCLLGRQYN